MASLDKAPPQSRKKPINDGETMGFFSRILYYFITLIFGTTPTPTVNEQTPKVSIDDTYPFIDLTYKPPTPSPTVSKVSKAASFLLIIAVMAPPSIIAGVRQDDANNKIKNLTARTVAQQARKDESNQAPVKSNQDLSQPAILPQRKRIAKNNPEKDVEKDSGTNSVIKRSPEKSLINSCNNFFHPVEVTQTNSISFLTLIGTAANTFKYNAVNVVETIATKIWNIAKAICVDEAILHDIDNRPGLQAKRDLLIEGEFNSWTQFKDEYMQASHYSGFDGGKYIHQM